MHHFTDEQMDIAVFKYRQAASEEEFYLWLDEDPKHRGAYEAAYERGQKDPSKKFTDVDAAGAHPAQFCVPVPPARPPTTDFREQLATEQNEAAERRRLGLPLKPPKRATFVIPNDF
jgi:hypothetical protein